MKEHIFSQLLRENDNAQKSLQDSVWSQLNKIDNQDALYAVVYSFYFVSSLYIAGDSITRAISAHVSEVMIEKEP